MDKKENENAASENGISTNIKNDFLASVVVFLVALPLCMGIAIASGVPVAAGLMTGIVGGLVVGSLAGCPLQVSGPAAGLTVIVYEIVQEFGFEMLGIVVLMGGLIQLAAGLCKLGQWFRAVSPAVIKGMLAGIGVLIFASQFHVMVDDKPKGSGLTNLVTIPSAIRKALAWPDFGTPEKRGARTEAMRNVGELHRRQAAIAERVAERLPDHTAEDVLALETPQQLAEHAAALRELVPQQEALANEVEKLLTDMAAFERQVGNGDRSKRIIAACQPAIIATRDTLVELNEGHVIKALRDQSAAVTALEQLSSSLQSHALAAQIGILTIGIILLWQAFAPRQLKMVPAPLIAVVVAAGLATVAQMPVIYVEVPNSLWTEIHFPTWAILSDAPWKLLFQSAVVVAVVASAETLLCATAVDQMQQGPRTRYDRELAAQGVGNMICGLLGALPMTGVIVRSSANVQSGGKTRASAILHGVWLLVFVVFLAFLLRLIPTSALAAILVYTGYKLINPKSIRELRKYGWGEVAIYAATVVTIVVSDLLTGVIVGVTLAAAKLLHTFSHLETNLTLNPASNQATLSLHGAATFVRLPKLANELEQVPVAWELHVDFQHLDYIDHACLDLLMNWAKQHESTGGTMIIDWSSLRARFNPENGRKHDATDRAAGDRQAEPEESAAGQAES